MDILELSEKSEFHNYDLVIDVNTIYKLRSHNLQSFHEHGKDPAKTNGR